MKYGNPKALFDEKNREDELRRLGYEMVRIIWTDLDRPDFVRAKLLEAFDRARRNSAA
ncbi:hypothetical protein [Ornithinimicrobium sp. INDO-MA30-4]|uniref:hypothetical protein n=1 Tax=Ornithinimicrobium sp. INDO-MA30-4 TaxID=2908651 RepID=UPI001F3DA387|nr:hypothetical protein [Ornithinimicrobium sp. INDO-MA30-4]UJH69423.1 hypothetical protein L0A91_08305 [Ornithinimicrobium sp. INDO-MA30-4]